MGMKEMTFGLEDEEKGVLRGRRVVWYAGEAMEKVYEECKMV
jgi:hypothetical protein